VSKPTFKMPACSHHFFKGHKWWCRPCDRETESQFRETAEAWWEVAPLARLASEATVRVHAPDGTVTEHNDWQIGWRPDGEGDA
jgi:hypothetical protein